MKITIVCQNEKCGKESEIESNNGMLRYWSKDNSIIDRDKNRLTCPKCGGLELKFKDYEKA